MIIENTKMLTIHDCKIIIDKDSYIIDIGNEVGISPSENVIYEHVNSFKEYMERIDN